MFLEYIKEKIQKVNLKTLFGITAAAVILSFAYYKMKSLRQRKKIVTREASQIISQISHDTVQVNDNFERQFARVINSIKKWIPQKGRLDIQGMKAIFMGQIELSRHSFESIIRRNRQNRREMLMNLLTYKQAVLQLQYSIQDLHSSNLNAILAHFKIDKRNWYQMIEQISTQQNDAWQQMILQADTIQLDFLRDKNIPPLSMQSLTNIFKYKSEVVEELVQSMKQICKFNDRNQLFSILDKRMSDLIFNQFKVQQEDINYALTKLSEHEHKILEEIEEKVSIVLQKLIEQLENE